MRKRDRLCTKGHVAARKPLAVVTVSQPLEKKSHGSDDLHWPDGGGRIGHDVRAAGERSYLVEIGYRPGQEVKEGQLLFRIDPTIYEAALEKAKADVNQFGAQVRLSESEYTRTKRLVTAKAIAQEEVDRTIAQRDEGVFMNEWRPRRPPWKTKRKRISSGPR